MRGLLVGLAAPLAAVFVATAPAEAQGFAAGSGTQSGPFDGPFPVAVSGDRDGRRDGRRNRGSDAIFIYDRGYQGDSAWRSNSFNDWWHDQPLRSYPRWMLANQKCERVWWQGGGWRC